MTTEPERGRWTPGLVLGAAAAVALAVGAFMVLDVVYASAVAIVLGTGLMIAVLASDWDQHSTFEERELARARRRREKWEQNAGARERDRLRWEAHQARQAAQADRSDRTGTDS